MENEELKIILRTYFSFLEKILNQKNVMFDFIKKYNNSITKSIWVLLLIVWSSSFAFSFQNYSPTEDYLESEIVERKFDASTWENTVSGIDYSKQKDVKPKEEKELTDDDLDDDRNYESEEELPAQNMSDFWRGFFKFFLIALAVIVLAFIIGNMVGAEGWALAPTNRKIQPVNTAVPITLENIEENIHESDLDRFLREALEKENYAQAVRLYYLAIIKELSLKRWIKWKKDKTNRDYSRELSGSNFQNPFREITRIFERVWYGNNTLTSSDFNESLQPKLKQLLDLVKQTGRKL